MIESARFPLVAKDLPPESWRPVEHAGSRSSNRVSEREFIHIPAFLALPDPASGSRTVPLPVRLWDFSLHGFAVLLEKNALPPGLEIGARVGLTLDLGEGPLGAECIVKNIGRMQNRVRLGLARRDLARRSHPEGPATAPQGEYLRIPHRTGFPATAANPVFHGEASPLILCGLRPGPVFEFLSSDPSLPLFRGQRLDLSLTLPTDIGNRCAAVVENLELAPGANLKIRLRPVGLTEALANELSAFLVFEAGLAPDAMRRFGFPTRVFRERIRFDFVSTMAEYDQVLFLRRNAYVAAGKKGEETAPEAMSFAWDRRSRILCGFHEGKVVASAALTFPEDASPPLRSEAPFPDGKFPGDPPARSTIVEVGALCTHKDYRRGDLLRALFEHIARIFVLSDRRCIMTLCEGSLLPLYLGIGFRELGQTVELMGRPHHLIRLDKETMTESRGLGLLRWNRLYGEMMRDLANKGLYRPAGTETWKLPARLALAPLAKAMQGRAKERRFRMRPRPSAGGES